VLAAGCSNPLGREPFDTSSAAATDRLREIRSLPVRRVEAPPTPTAESVAAARARYEAAERVALSLEEVRAATLTNNLDLQVQLVEPTIAAAGVDEEVGKFEAAFTLAGAWVETDDAVPNTLDGGSSRFQQLTPGVRVPLWTGGEANITLPVSRTQTDRPFTTLNPAVTTDLQFSLSHNLLRGAGRRATTYALRVAEFNRQTTEAQTKLEVIRQLAAADRAYWRLYAAQRALDVRAQQVELARVQFDAAGRRLRAGQGPEVDVVRAESGVADRVEGLLVAQNDVLLRQRELKRLANIPGLDVDSPARVVPSSDPDPVRYVFEPGELEALALQNRMEMLELEIRLAADAAAVAFEKNQALPLLAMEYTYRVNGLGGSSGESFSVLDDNRFEDWSVGLRAEVPLGNEERRARVARAVLTRLQRLATREAREQSIRKEVYDAIDQLDSAWQRILAARQSVQLNTRLVEAEQRQFEVGRTTSTDVLDADTRLAEARLAEISALVDYQIAQVDLAFATGTMLGAAKVEWAPADPRGGPRDTAPVARYQPTDGVIEFERRPGRPARASDAVPAAPATAENAAAPAEPAAPAAAPASSVIISPASAGSD
jgi:outer membrane protein TolC